MMKFIVLTLIAASLIILPGCNDSQPVKVSKKKTTRVAAKNKKPVVDDIAIVEKKELFRYQSENRRDPFVTLLKIREPIAEEVETETPLQTFGLKELRLIAIVIGQDEPRAMVVAPDNKAYTLVTGIKVGRNRGIVQKITESEVVVEERFRDFSGGLRTEIKKITLPQDEGE